MAIYTTYIALAVHGVARRDEEFFIYLTIVNSRVVSISSSLNLAEFCELFKSRVFRPSSSTPFSVA